MSSSKMQVSLWTFKTHEAFDNDSMACFCILIHFHTVRHLTFLCTDLTNLSTHFCHRLTDGELVTYVVPSPPNDHHCGVHLLCHIAGASDHGEPQSLRPQGSPHSLQLRRGGSLALHVLWSESSCYLFASITAQWTCKFPTATHTQRLTVEPTSVFLVLLSTLWRTEPWHMPLEVLRNTLVPGLVLFLLNLTIWSELKPARQV